MKNFWINKKVIVTGGAGFIGSHVVDDLVKKGAKVSIPISPKTDKKKIETHLSQVLDKVIFEKVDLLQKKECISLFKNQDIVLHFAGLDGGAVFKSTYPVEILTTNTQMTLNILDAAKINKVDRILLISSIEVYPKNSKSPVIESYAFAGDMKDKTAAYGWSKRFGEIIARFYYQEYGLKIAIARLGNIYGPRDYIDTEKSRVIPTFINNALQEKEITIFGDGSAERSFLYVKDASTALLKLVEKYPNAEAINIASNKMISLKELAQLIFDTCDKKKKIEYIKNVDIKNVNKKISIHKAKKLLQFEEKTDIQTGLQETISYYKNLL